MFKIDQEYLNYINYGVKTIELRTLSSCKEKNFNNKSKTITFKSNDDGTSSSFKVDKVVYKNFNKINKKEFLQIFGIDLFIFNGTVFDQQYEALLYYIDKFQKRLNLDNDEPMVLIYIKPLSLPMKILNKLNL